MSCKAAVKVAAPRIALAVPERPYLCTRNLKALPKIVLRCHLPHSKRGFDALYWHR